LSQQNAFHRETKHPVIGPLETRNRQSKILTFFYPTSSPMMHLRACGFIFMVYQKSRNRRQSSLRSSCPFNLRVAPAPFPVRAGYPRRRKSSPVGTLATGASCQGCLGQTATNAAHATGEAFGKVAFMIAQNQAHGRLSFVFNRGIGRPPGGKTRA